jgi:mono/diheme cytochrome c family protein
MSRFPSLAAASMAIAMAATPTLAGKLNLGREALPGEIAAWDIDVRPDGTGLPEGRGTVARGMEIFDERCATCHGEFGEGAGRWPELAGGQGSLRSEDPVKTIGSYWPYLSSAFDYVHRAMPFGDAQSLAPDETYALVAYLLYLNDIVTDESFELSKENFTSIRLPNEVNFFDDPRPDAKNIRDGEPCMTDCKETVEITRRARVLDVTPDGDSDNGAKIE